MKSLVVFIFFFTYCFIQAQTWSWSSENPVAGQELTVTVKNLDIEEDIHIVGYYFQGNDLVSSDINYIVDDGGLKMSLKAPETNWIRIVVKDENNQVVTGDHRDIAWAGTPSKSALVDYANATAAYYRVMGLARNESEVTQMYRQAIQANPAWLDNPVLLRNYYNMAKASAAAEDLKQISSHIESCEMKPDPVSQDYLISAIRIAKETGDTTLHKSLRKKLNQSYPQSIINQEEQLELFSRASSMADKILLREKFKVNYPVTDYNRGIYDQMTSSLVQECAAKEDWEKMKEYVNEIIDPSTKASVCNNFAWTLAGEGIDNEAKQLDLASDLSSTSISLMTPQLRKPATFSQSEWERNLEYSKAMYGDTYAVILYKQGKYDDALALQQKAVEMYDFDDIEMNERYVVYLDKANKKEELMSFTENMIKSGKASMKMKEMHEQIWTKEKTQEQLYDQYVAQLESVAKMKRIEELKGTWMETSSIPFTLKDLDGKTISLADYKGKTVVLDFWATWCGPCKSSFPGMKNAVEHYSSDDDVVFFFVNTWEKGDHISDKVKKFIDDNQYPFHVLMDSESKIVSDYKVEGIPTKFIIGPDQKIRFKSVGYNGNNEVLTEEVITMIDMARQGRKILTP
ncbi:MAG TPA: redoxin domain-containing protein [Saprospiraceae bacterium]|nr:redoxin domain-containing protein [Saprospiraceae bacterium]